MQQHWDALTPKLDNYSMGVTVSMTESFCDPADRDSVQQFFTAHPLPAAERSLRQTMEAIGNCIDMRQRQSANLASWLQAQPTARAAK